jgi:hypothetical protein
LNSTPAEIFEKRFLIGRNDGGRPVAPGKKMQLESAPSRIEQ